MASIFSRIIAGEIPCHKLAEDDRYISFLDIAPIAMGHALVVPKVEIDDVFDLPEDVLAGLLPFAQRLAAGLRQVLPCQRIGLSVIGLEVPHAHLHLVPISTLADMDFGRERLKLSHEQLAQLALQVAQCIGQP